MLIRRWSALSRPGRDGPGTGYGFIPICIPITALSVGMFLGTSYAAIPFSLSSFSNLFAAALVASGASTSTKTAIPAVMLFKNELGGCVNFCHPAPSRASDICEPISVTSFTKYASYKNFCPENFSSSRFMSAIWALESLRAASRFCNTIISSLWMWLIRPSIANIIAPQNNSTASDFTNTSQPYAWTSSGNDFLSQYTPSKTPAVATTYARIRASFHEPSTSTFEKSKISVLNILLPVAGVLNALSLFVYVSRRRKRR